MLAAISTSVSGRLFPITKTLSGPKLIKLPPKFFTWIKNEKQQYYLRSFKAQNMNNTEVNELISPPTMKLTKACLVLKYC